MLKDKVLLITGGTGSFGSTVLKHVLDSDVKEIRIFSRDESKQEALRNHYHSEKLKFYIGDVRDFDSIKSATTSVDYIFHAAALKQVPSCEFYPMEAVKTNILGTENVIKAAISSDVERVVFLSTDKAVYPINAMGMTKALMEKIMISQARMPESSTIFCATRYGNVMASRGSVIPLFVEQILCNKALTLTDPDMTRFLMSLNDSVDLVLHALTNGLQGDLFVQKAPSSTIKTLADAMLDLFNSSAGYKIIGTRHGEKLFETLLSREEKTRAIEVDRYFRIPMDDRDLNYDNYFAIGEDSISNNTDYTSHNTEILDHEGVKNLLLNLEFIKERLDA